MLNGNKEQKTNGIYFLIKLKNISNFHAFNK